MTEIKQDKINKVLNRKINLLRKEDTIEVVILENYLHSAMHTFSMSPVIKNRLTGEKQTEV